MGPGIQNLLRGFNLSVCVPALFSSWTNSLKLVVYNPSFRNPRKEKKFFAFLSSAKIQNWFIWPRLDPIPIPELIIIRMRREEWVIQTGQPRSPAHLVVAPRRKRNKDKVGENPRSHYICWGSLSLVYSFSNQYLLRVYRRPKFKSGIWEGNKKEHKSVLLQYDPTERRTLKCLP